ncbi:Hypothetical protein PMT_2745 [Prochlorococcus marinus str. MIT 9313]|uniref:Uncharacterized protein n=1 Tax=Prochlorococcus marinus (strain MIT 9313) TaxID=74547 RepID=B9ESC4_PROMM|nr:Hypothetical protein PMT_2745 [Prochlorococcus marinus str. MIT 9313]
MSKFVKAVEKVKSKFKQWVSRPLPILSHSDLQPYLPLITPRATPVNMPPVEGSWAC